METYTLLCSCGCGMPMGTVESDPGQFRGQTGYNTYVQGHFIPGLSYMSDGTYVTKTGD